MQIVLPDLQSMAYRLERTNIKTLYGSHTLLFYRTLKRRKQASYSNTLFARSIHKMHKMKFNVEVNHVSPHVCREISSKLRGIH